MSKTVVYMPIGKDLDMLRFSSKMLIKNSGLELNKDYEFICITGWNTSSEVYRYLNDNNIKFFNVPDLKEGKENWLHNLYSCWNYGYTVGYDILKADIVVPVGSDHAFYKNWLKNLIKYCKPNTICNCKLIESGQCPSLHTCMDFGKTIEDEFKYEDFIMYCNNISEPIMVADEEMYGHRFDAMPMAISKDVWDRFGPMNLDIVNGITGDTNFFNRCNDGKVRIIKILEAISYHFGAASTDKSVKVK